MKRFSKVHQWHQTGTGLMVFALAEFGLSYVFVSWAINSGRLSAWILAIVLAIGAIQNFIKLIWNLVHGRTAKA
jgi:hypothetical protein